MRLARGAGFAALGALAGGAGWLVRERARDARHVDALWQRLAAATPAAPGEPFSEAHLSGLPASAQRYFRHAIAPGTPLASSLRWRYHGQMKPGATLPWMALRAEQLLVREHGFVWRARARRGPLAVEVADHWVAGDARMRVALWGLLPVVDAGGPDLARSALGRLAIEGLALPSAFLPGPHVRLAALDDERFSVTLALAGESLPLTLRVDADGRLREVTMQRWGNVTPDGSFGPIPYGVTIAAERTFGGYTIPSEVAGGWWYGTERYLEVLRLVVDEATLA